MLAKVRIPPGFLHKHPEEVKVSQALLNQSEPLRLLPIFEQHRTLPQQCAGGNEMQAQML